MNWIPYVSGAVGAIGSWLGQEDANEANKRRYRRLLDIAREGRDREARMLEGLGEGTRRDIMEKWQGVRTRSGQDLVSRGLAASTAAPAAAAQAQRGESRDVLSLEDTLRRGKVESGRYWDRMLSSFVEGRSDTGPSMNWTQHLASLGKLAASDVEERRRRRRAPASSSRDSTYPALRPYWQE